MKRKDRIYNEIRKLSQKIDKESLFYNSSIGYSAQSISENLNIARNSVSQELNILNKEGKVIKVKSRPVLFIEKYHIENLLNTTIDKEDYEVKSFEVLRKKYLVKKNEKNFKNQDRNPFKNLIGYDKSLKEAIYKAKSAIFYPPNGLHVLLTGESGVGKTYFAELMYRFYELYNKTDTAVPFVYFNCSEYYNNPELLTGQLFGYTQGAFTGAVNDKDGLIKKADGGFFFLDEIHRLPAEGQEKLFSLLDKGKFRKLGSSNKEEKVTVRLIGATTCDVNSTFLKTFLRRIQVVIEIPSLKERTLQERLEMILKFLQQESIKTNLDIRLSYDFAYYLMTHEFEGNIGELKSEIQYKCAQAFLNVMTKGYNSIVLDDTFVTEKISKKELGVKNLLKSIYKNNEFIIINTQNTNLYTKEIDLKELEDDKINFYSLLIKEYSVLMEKELSHSEIKVLLENKIQTLFQYTFHNKLQSMSTKKVIDEPMASKINKIIGKIEEVTGRILDDNNKNSFYLHIYSFLSYMKKGDTPPVYNTSYIVDDYKKEYDEAKIICRYMSEVLNIPCPKSELIFITLFLNAVYNSSPIKAMDRNCGVILIAHGNTTATSMASFANDLFRTDILQSIDMPIDQSIGETLEKLINIIKNRKYKEIILLVDMGSLVSFGQIIEKQLGIKTLVVKNINTEFLLEVTRKVIYDLKPLDEMKSYFKKLSCGDSLIVESKKIAEKKSRVLITSCITGIGTANKIKVLIENTFKDLLPQDFRIESKEYHNIDSQEKLLNQINEDEEIIGVIGTFNINVLDIPFISLEELFSENGIELLIDIIGISDRIGDCGDDTKQITKKFVSSITLQSIIDYLTILNPEKILLEVEEALSNICEKLDLAITKQIRLRFLIHCCCMVERIIVMKKPMEYEARYKSLDYNEKFTVIKLSFSKIERNYGIQLSHSEISCIYELLYNKTP